MQPLNAFDAIGPAFTRTHEVLFPKPWKLGRVWKLCVTQYLGLMGGVFIPFFFFILFLPKQAFASTTSIVTVLGLTAVLTALMFYFFYLGVRLEFVNFEMLVTRARFVAPMWRRYGSRTWPFLWAKIGVGSGLSLLMLPLLVKSGRALIAVMEAMPRPVPGQPPDPQQFATVFHLLFSVYCVLAVVFLVLKTASTLLEDFVLPFYILEDVTFPGALREGWAVWRADPWQCALYTVLKPILATIGFVMQYIANLVFAIPAAIVLVLVIVAGTLLFPHGSGGGMVVAIVLGAIAYLCFIAYSMFVSLGSFGYYMMVLQAYSIYFLAGRYPRLGNLLEPQSYLYTPPPSFPSAEERKDDSDDGPSLPMNPALA